MNEIDVKTADKDGHIAVVNFILDLCSKKELSEILDFHGRTPLHLAAAKGHEEAVRVLLVFHKVCKVDNFGLTAFHFGAANGHLEVIKILLKHFDLDWHLQNEIQLTKPRINVSQYNIFVTLKFQFSNFSLFRIFYGICQGFFEV